LNVSDANLFVSMILQRPYNVSTELKDVIKFGKVLLKTTQQISKFKKMKHMIGAKVTSEQENKQMQTQAQRRMEEIVGTLKDIPRPMLMVIRSMNLIRALSFDLGAPVNRFTLLAKSALRGIREHNHGTRLEQFHDFSEELHFNFNLRWMVFSFWLQKVCIRVLQAFHLMPKDLGIMEAYISA